MRSRAAIAGGVLLAALAGCAAPPEPVVTESPSARPTSTPTPIVLEVPGTRIPAGCGDLLPPGLIGDGWTLARDGVIGTPQTALQTVRRQAATTDCSFAGPDGASFDFLMIPDAGIEELHFSIVHLLTEGVLHDPFGPNSLLVCDPAGCDVSAAVADDYWFAGRAEGLQAEALIPLLTDLRARADAAAAEVGRAWELPPAVHPGWGRTCGEKGLVDGIRRLAFDPRLEEADIRFAEHDLVVVDRVDPAYCYLVDPDDPEVEILLALVPGGAWVVQELAADPEPFARVELESLGTVLVSGDPSRYTALTVLQGSLVQIGMPAADRDAFLDVLPDVVDLIRRTPYTPPVED